MLNVARGLELLATINWTRTGSHGTMIATADCLVANGPPPETMNEESVARLKEYGWLYDKLFQRWVHFHG